MNPERAHSELPEIAGNEVQSVAAESHLQPADPGRRRLCLWLAALAALPLAGSGKDRQAAGRPLVRTRPWRTHRFTPGNHLAG